MPHKGNATVLKNKAGVEVHVLSTGAIIQRLLVPDKDGQWAENPQSRPCLCLARAACIWAPVR